MLRMRINILEAKSTGSVSVPVVHIDTTNIIHASIIGSGVVRITIFGKCCRIPVLLRKAFGADAIAHAGCVWIGSATWSVNHACLDRLEQQRLRLWIRPLRRDAGIDGLWGRELVAVFEE